MIKKILHSSIFLLIANILGRLSIFVANILAARLLPQEVFGQYTMLRSTVTMFENIITGSVGPIIIKRTAQSSIKTTEELSITLVSIFFINISIAISLSILLFINSSYIIETYFVLTPYIETGFKISLLLLIASILSITLQKIFIGLEYYKKSALLSLYISLISIVFIWIMINYFQFFGILYGILFYFLLDFIVKFIFLKKQHKLFTFDYNKILIEIKYFFSFSYPLLLAIIVSSISFWYARVLLVKQTNEYSELAIFDAAYQWLTIIMIITGATTSVALPMLSKISKINLKDDEISIFKINFIINILIASFIAIIFITFSSFIMSVYGEKYVEGKNILIILSVTSIFFTISSLLNKYLISREYKWIIFFNIFISTFVLYIVLYNYIEFGVIALAFSLLSFYISNSLIYSLYIMIQKN